jgi:hypothetical protein
MSTDIQDLRDFQRAVLEGILSHPVRENKYGRSKEDQDLRSAALVPLWQAFIKGAKAPAGPLLRHRQLREIDHLPWYLGPGAEEAAEFYLARAAELQDERLSDGRDMTLAFVTASSWLKTSADMSSPVSIMKAQALGAK